MRGRRMNQAERSRRRGEGDWVKEEASLGESNSAQRQPNYLSWDSGQTIFSPIQLVFTKGPKWSIGVPQIHHHPRLDGAHSRQHEGWDTLSWDILPKKSSARCTRPPMLILTLGGKSLHFVFVLFCYIGPKKLNVSSWSVLIWHGWWVSPTSWGWNLLLGGGGEDDNPIQVKERWKNTDIPSNREGDLKWKV